MKKLLSRVMLLIMLILPYFMAISENLVSNISYENINGFYLKKPEDILKSDSVTYFISNSPIDEKINKLFMGFADRLGKKHGAISISFNDNNDLKIMDYMLLSNCDFSLYDLPVIVYEDRQKKSCYPFENISNDELYLVLFRLYKATKDKKKITGDYIKIQLKKILPATIKKDKREKALKAFITFFYSLFNI